MSRLYPLLFLVVSLFIPTIIGQGVIFLVLIFLHLFYRRRKGWTRAFFLQVLAVFVFVLLGTIPLLIVRVVDFEGALWILLNDWGVTQASLNVAILVGGRCLNAALTLSLLLYITPIYYLLLKLKDWGIPKTLLDLIELTYRFIHLFLERAREIKIAQKSRWAYNGYAANIQHTGLLLSRTFVLGHEYGEIMYEAMLARGGMEGDGNEKETTTATPQRGAVKEPNVPLLKVVALAHHFDGMSLPLFEEISLTVSKGGRVALLGANGEGKSTLLRIFAGLLKPSKGDLYIHGEATPFASKYLRGCVGFLFQNTDAQLFCPTVWEEIAFGLRNKGLKGNELTTAVEATLTQFNIKELESLPPHHLSGGQKRWVVLAAIVATNPEILLLDEPFSGLDQIHSLALSKILESLHQAGHTIIVSTHDTGFAFRWADTIWELEKRAIAVFPTRHGSPTTSSDDTYKIRTSSTLPLFMKASHNHALIVGGGKGALRKGKTLSDANFLFDVIAPDVTPELESITTGKVIRRAYQTGDLQGYQLIILATGDPNQEKEIISEAQRWNIPYTSIGFPKESMFHFGAVARCNGVEVGVHTRYQLPEVAQKIRDLFKTSLLDSIDVVTLEKLSLLRRKLQNKELDLSEKIRLQDEYEALKRKL